MTCALVIAVSQVPTASGAVLNQPAADAAPVLLEGGDARARWSSDLHSIRVTRRGCASARRGLAWYQKRAADWRERMGAPGTMAATNPRFCPQLRRLAEVWRWKAHVARYRYTQWHRYHWEWRRWLPDKWQRIGACETGYGKRPGDWHWNSGTYEGAFGFYFGTWDAYKPRGAPSRADLATPRQQYQAALNVYAEHGYGAWGCGGA